MLFAYVIEQLSMHSLSLKELTNRCAEMFKIEDKSTLKKEMTAFVKDLLYQKMILGFRK
jgi:hypothetical protein